MGNRAVITTKAALLDKKGVANSNEVGVYLHWNGGRDSVQAFLTYCKLKGFRTPETDCYGWARLCQVISNFFGDGLSIGIDRCCNLDCDNFDNGVYIIENWEIVGREYFDSFEQDCHDLKEMLIEINNSQPDDFKIDEYFLEGEFVERDELEVGDVIFIQDFSGKWLKKRVVEINDDGFPVVALCEYYNSWLDSIDWRRDSSNTIKKDKFVRLSAGQLCCYNRDLSDSLVGSTVKYLNDEYYVVADDYEALEEHHGDKILSIFIVSKQVLFDYGYKDDNISNFIRNENLDSFCHWVQAEYVTKESE